MVRLSSWLRLGTRTSQVQCHGNLEETHACGWHPASRMTCQTAKQQRRYIGWWHHTSLAPTLDVITPVWLAVGIPFYSKFDLPPWTRCLAGVKKHEKDESTGKRKREQKFEENQMRSLEIIWMNGLRYVLKYFKNDVSWISNQTDGQSL